MNHMHPEIVPSAVRTARFAIFCLWRTTAASLRVGVAETWRVMALCELLRELRFHFI